MSPSFSSATPPRATLKWHHVPTTQGERRSSTYSHAQGSAPSSKPGPGHAWGQGGARYALCVPAQGAAVCRSWACWAGMAGSRTEQRQGLLLAVHEVDAEQVRKVHDLCSGSGASARIQARVACREQCRVKYWEAHRDAATRQAKLLLYFLPEASLRWERAFSSSRPGRLGDPRQPD